MNERTALYRKLAYLAAIAVLLFPLALLSSPATVRDPGGKLAQLRSEYELGQSDLGAVDPASETMKLATLGLRGVAVNVLWNKAMYYKKTEDWSSLTATLEQLAKLQPNVVRFWIFQSWNLSYNVSVQFDDYHDRYYYVRRGIEFLEEGTKYNRDNPELLAELGWFIGQKIGRADERVQYRRLFKADDDYHPADRLPEQRDNWLVSKDWYLEAVDAAEEKGIGRKSPIVFYSAPAKSQMSYAEAIELEGLFEKAKNAWRVSEEEWRDFGNREIRHSLTGTPLRFNEHSGVQEKITQLAEELDGLAPGSREELVEQARAQFTDEERAALDTPLEDRSDEQWRLASAAEQKMNVTHMQLAQYIASQHPELAEQAKAIADELDEATTLIGYISSYKQIANYDYWATRAKFEQTPAALEARERIYLAKKAKDEATDLVAAKQYFEEGFDAWAQVFEEFPVLLSDSDTTGDEVADEIEEYYEVLQQLDLEIADDFPLWNILENYDDEQNFVELVQLHKQRVGGEGEGAAAPQQDSGDDEESPDSAPSDANEENASDIEGEATPDDADAAPPETETGDDSPADPPGEEPTPDEPAEAPSADEQPAEGEPADDPAAADVDESEDRPATDSSEPEAEDSGESEAAAQPADGAAR